MIKNVNKSIKLGLSITLFFLCNILYSQEREIYLTDGYTGVDEIKIELYSYDRGFQQIYKGFAKTDETLGLVKIIKFEMIGINAKYIVLTKNNIEFVRFYVDKKLFKRKMALLISVSTEGSFQIKYFRKSKLFFM